MDRKKWGVEMNLGNFFGGCTIMSYKICEDTRNGGRSFFFKLTCCARKYPVFTSFSQGFGGGSRHIGSEMGGGGKDMTPYNFFWKTEKGVGGDGRLKEWEGWRWMIKLFFGTLPYGLIFKSC